MITVSLTMYGTDDTARPRRFYFSPSKLRQTCKSMQAANKVFDQMIDRYGGKFKPSYTYGVFVTINKDGKPVRTMQIN